MMSLITEFELDVGLFQRLLDALDVAGLLAADLLAGAQQRAEFLLRLVRHEAGPDQPARQQIGDPHGIVHVGLPARHGPRVKPGDKP